MFLELSKPSLLARLDPFNKTGRRGAARLRLSVPARLVSLYDTRRCVLLDLSRSGARVAMERPLPMGDGAFLQVNTIDHFAGVVRRDEGLNGLEFETPLAQDQVLAMRQFAEGFAEAEKRELRESVRAWVTGTS